MLYIERQPHKSSVLLLFLLGMAVYAVSLCLLEIRGGDEGLYAAMVRDMGHTGDYLQTSLYGRPIREFPLYSWLVALFSGGGEPTVWSLRLPSFLALAGMAAVSAFGAKRLQSGFAGFVAASVVVLSVVSFRLGVRGQAALLQAFLTGSAWWVWFYLGVDRHRWDAAWACSLSLVFLGVLNTGIQAVFWFYFPMLFMPRRVNSRGRMKMQVHVLCALLLVTMICAWQMLNPEQVLVPWRREILGMGSASGENYLWGRLVFPLKMLVYLFPWSLLVWSPFCEALRQFENIPYACRYLRVLIIVMFLWVWLTPGSSPLQLLPLLMPIAMLIGVHFEIVLRRHQRGLRCLVHAVAWSTVVLGLCASAWWLGVATGCVAMAGISPLQTWTFAVVPAVMAVLLYGVILRPASTCTFRSSFVWCICSVRLLMLSTVESYVNWKAADSRWRGETLIGESRFDASVLGVEPSDAPMEAGAWRKVCKDVDKVYYRPEKGDSYIHLVEFGVLRKPVVYVSPKREWGSVFSDDEKRVYVLARYVPEVANRTWRALGDPMDMRLKRETHGCIHHGGRPWIVISREPKVKLEHAPLIIQLFEGTLQDAEPEQEI